MKQGPVSIPDRHRRQLKSQGFGLSCCSALVGKATAAEIEWPGNLGAASPQVGAGLPGSKANSVHRTKALRQQANLPVRLPPLNYCVNASAAH